LASSVTLPATPLFSPRSIFISLKFVSVSIYLLCITMWLCKPFLFNILCIFLLLFLILSSFLCS
jgi:hypothetical protein